MATMQASQGWEKVKKGLECNTVYYAACGEDLPVAGHTAGNLSVIHTLKFPEFWSPHFCSQSEDINIRMILNLANEALIIWPPNAKSRLIGKDPDAGRD